MFRPSREPPTGDEPLLLWKVRLFVIGAALGIVGMVRNTTWLVWGGIGLLGVAVILRFVRRPSELGDQAEQK